MKRRRRVNIKMTMGLTLVPMLDMMTVVLIFLIVNFSPDKANVKKEDQLILPKAELNMRDVPKIQIEITKNELKVNGTALEGLNPFEATKEAWAILKAKLDEISPESQPVLLVADKGTEYIFVDRTVAHLAAAGFSDVYLLTEREERVQQ